MFCVYTPLPSVLVPHRSGKHHPPSWYHPIDGGLDRMWGNGRGGEWVHKQSTIKKRKNCSLTAKSMALLSLSLSLENWTISCSRYNRWFCSPVSARGLNTQTSGKKHYHVTRDYSRSMASHLLFSSWLSNPRPTSTFPFFSLDWGLYRINVFLSGFSDF